MNDEEQINEIRKHKKILFSKEVSIKEKCQYILDNFPKYIPEKPVDRGRLINWWILVRSELFSDLMYVAHWNKEYIPLQINRSKYVDCNYLSFRLDKNHLSIASNSKIINLENLIGRELNLSDVSMVHFWRVKIKKVNSKISYSQHLNIPLYVLDIEVSKTYLGNNWEAVNNLNNVDFFEVEDRKIDIQKETEILDRIRIIKEAYEK